MQTEQAINSGNRNIIKPRKALNKAFLKVKPNRSQIEQFKQNLVTDFLKKTYYDPNQSGKVTASKMKKAIDEILYGIVEHNEQTPAA